MNRQNNHGVKFRPTTAREDDTFSHEVWTWGKGHRGQHGHGDMLDRLVKLDCKHLNVSLNLYFSSQELPFLKGISRVARVKGHIVIPGGQIMQVKIFSYPLDYNPRQFLS